jgi:hypothetical protein
MAAVRGVGSLVADSDEFSRRFRLKPATDSDRSQPGFPMIPARVVVRVASGVN